MDVMTVYLLAGIMAVTLAIYNSPPLPPQSAFVGFNTSEMPANVSLYYDTSRPPDGKVDIIFAHPIISQREVKQCPVKLYSSELYRMISTCAGPDTYKPVVYTILKSPTAWRLPGLRWQNIYRVACRKTICEVE